MIAALPPSTSLLCIDDLCAYQPFYQDFGPLHLGCTVRFCNAVDGLLSSPSHVLYVHCNATKEAKSNAAVLLGAYQVWRLHRSAASAYEALRGLEPFVAFRDASIGPHLYKLTPAHAIDAFAAALRVGLFEPAAFSVDEYEHFEHVENGDLNVVVPHRFIAFASPNPPPSPTSPHLSFTPFTPNDYLPIFRHFNVKAVVRLNQSSYHPAPFVAHGIRHVDLVFADGSNPSPSIVARFLAVCDEQEERGGGVVAVHCKAGLGRTGSLLGCWLMREYSMRACEAIAWLRLCRPGSVIGGQQEWMASMEAAMWKAGQARRARRTSPDLLHSARLKREESAEADLDDPADADAKTFDDHRPEQANPTSIAALSLGFDHQANGLLAMKALRAGKKSSPLGQGKEGREARRTEPGAPVHPMTTRVRSGVAAVVDTGKRRASVGAGALPAAASIRFTRSAVVSPMESPKLHSRALPVQSEEGAKHYGRSASSKRSSLQGEVHLTRRVA